MPSKKVVFIRPKAEDDLVSMWQYLAEHADSETASEYLRVIDTQLTKIATFPEMGRLQDRLYPNLRSFVLGQLLLFYLPHQRGIDLVRVLTSARDIEKIFGKKE